MLLYRTGIEGKVKEAGDSHTARLHDSSQYKTDGVADDCILTISTERFSCYLCMVLQARSKIETDLKVWGTDHIPAMIHHIGCVDSSQHHRI